MKKNITLKIVNLFTALLFAGGIASAQSTGFLNPTDTALPHGWTNPLLGMVSDAQWSTVTHGAGCNCPWLYLSWDGGNTYTTYKLIGPYDTLDSWKLAGTPTDLWGRAQWVDTEFTNKNFRLKIENPGMSISQGYKNFNFSIPTGATINGIEVNTQAHGNAAFTVFYLNALQVDVYYTSTTGVGSTVATSDNVELFPNPARNNITLRLTGMSQLKYSLFSIDGRKLLEKNAGTIGNDYTANINLEGLPAGIYIVRIESNLGTEFRKIAVQ